MLMDLLTSPAFGALANVIQVGTFLGVFWTIRVMRRDRELITIIARHDDGREKEIGKIPRRVLTRAEIVGWISMKAGPARLDFTQFNPDYKFRSRKVIVDLTPEDFDRVHAAG